MSKCVELGLKECRWCAFRHTVSFDDRSGMCWLDHYMGIIKGLTDTELKTHIIDQTRPNLNGYYDPDWFYYCSNAVKLMPEKAHIAEKLMLLL